MRFAKPCLSLIAICAMAIPTLGQINTADAKKKVLSKRAAEADAYRKLAECVKGLQINADTYVKDFVAESDIIQSELDAFIRGVKLGDPKWYADFSCEVPAEVTVAKVVETLKTIQTRHYKGDRVTGQDIEQMNKNIEKKVIKVVGMGAPREDLPPNLPGGVVDQLGGPPIPPEPPIPDLWIAMGPQARLMAVKAAETDAKRKLVERIIGLRVTSDTIVRDFVTESDTIHTVARGTLIGHTQTRVYYHHDEPIVEVTLEVPAESVITTIKTLQTRSIQGDRVKGSDITELSQRLQTQKFEATGMGIPPDKYLPQAQAAAQVQYPEWAKEKIRMSGNGVPPEDKAGTPQGKLLAARAAETDAKRKLAEHIKGLRISSETSVRDFVTQHDEISSYVDAVLVGASVDETKFDGDTAEVTVSVPGMQVWQVIYERVRVTRIQ